jgi:hypothetical protein
MRRYAWAAFGALIVVTFGQPLAAADPPRTAYSFSVNGQEEFPQITLVEGTADDFAPGDVVEIRGFRMVLGAERTQRYRFDPKEPNILWIETADHKPALAAIQITGDFNPLARFSSAQIAGLRGVRLEGWWEEVAQTLKHIDPQKVCIEVVSHCRENQPCLIPPLPHTVRYLSIQERTRGGLRDYRPLLEMKELRYLDIHALAVAFDCRLLANATRLEHLSLVGLKGIHHLDSVRQLKTLRSLDLSGNPQLRTIDLAVDLPNLRAIGLTMTGVSDLRPLAGHPHLEVIDADYSRVEQLPLERSLPAMRRLELLSTLVSDAAVAEFARKNPRCRINRHFLPKLTPRLTGVDRLRVRDTDNPTRTSYVERDPAAVRAFVGQIKMDDSQHGGHCLCVGWPALEFYRQDQLVATLSVQHWARLRWSGWPEDGVMTADCAAFVRKWLADHSSEIRTTQEREQAATNEEARESERFGAPFPPDVRPLLTERSGHRPSREGLRRFFAAEPGDPVFGDIIVREIVAKMPDEVALTIACCRALGSLEGMTASWNVSSNQEQRAIAAALSVGGDAFAEALEKIKGEPRALSGAARLYFYAKMSQRLSPETRRKWTARLAEVVVADKHTRNQPDLLRALTRFDDPETVALLKDILQGKKGVEGTNDWTEEPSLRVQAALTLARQSRAEIKPQVQAQLPNASTPINRAGLEVALALLGDFDRLKAEQFRSPSFAIALGAIEAVERSRGAYGLDSLIEGVDDQWAALVDQVAERAVRRITGLQFKRGDKDAMEHWWKTQGAAFVAERKKNLGKKR